MSATMARQGGWGQLQQSHMCLDLNMAKMAKGGFSRAPIKEAQPLLKKSCAEVREEKMRCVELCGHTKVKAEMERHTAIIRKNHTDGCLPCPNGSA